MSASTGLLRRILPAAALLLAASQAHADPYAKLAKALGKGLKEAREGKAAVASFRYADGRASDGGAAVAASLQTELVRRKELSMVEREQLDKVLEELRLQNSGVVGADSALQAGRTVGARLLVTGTLADRGADSVEVNARIIRIETGEVLRAAKAKVPKTWTDSGPGGPGAPPLAGAVRVELSSGAFNGAVKRVGGRDLAFRYAHDGKNPVLRITDFTDPQKPRYKEISVPYEPATNQVAVFSKSFHLAGRSYRLWLDWELNLHIAPSSWLFGDDAEQEQVVGWKPVFAAFINDLWSRYKTLASGIQVGGWKKGDLIAYFEPLKKNDLRISVYFLQTGGPQPELDYQPRDAATLRGRRGRTITSRLLKAEGRFFRFRYRLDDRSVTVEEVR